MRIRLFALAAISSAAVLIIAAGCQHNGGSIPAALERNAPPMAFSESVPASIVHTGRFTEYTLPASSNPTYLANGPSNTVWFTHCGRSNLTPVVSSLSAATGAVHTYVADPVYSALASCAIANIGGKFWFPAIRFEMNENWLLNVTSTGAFGGYPLPFLNSSLRNLVLRSDGRIWYPYCETEPGFPCGGVVGSISPTGTYGPVNAIGPYQPGLATQGPDTNLYITGTAVPYPTPNPAAAVIVVSTAATIVHTFHLPNHSAPSGDATGPDGKIWIAEAGLNKIARMTTTGVLTHFSIPTANAGVFRITRAADGALWFTEANANKIGRITTTGAFTEVPVPTANSHPIGIIPCPTTVCGLHGGVWFTETAANKVGRYDFP